MISKFRIPTADIMISTVSRWHAKSVDHTFSDWLRGLRETKGFPLTSHRRRRRTSYM